MYKNYIKIAWRNLNRNKVYSAINILGLSIGLAVCMLITLFVKDEFSFDRFQKNKAEIFRLVTQESSPSNELFTYGETGMVHGFTFKEQIPEIQGLTRVQGTSLNIKHNNEIFVQQASKVDSSFFAFFNADFIEGTAHLALQDPKSIVISENVAKRFFGKEKALGKDISIEVDDEFTNFTVSGVTKTSPQNSSIQIEMLIPYSSKEKNDGEWINFYLNTFFLLKPNADVASIENKINAVFEVSAKDNLINAKKEWGFENKLTFKLQPFLDMHFSKTYLAQNGLKDSSNSTLSYVLIGLALFILIIGCINFVNISISHSIQRAKEIGIRKVVGGQRKELITQFLSESFLLSLSAFGLAILWVLLSLPTFNEMSSKSLSFNYLFDFKLVFTFVCIFLSTCFLAGFYPAIVLSSYRPVDTLYGKFKIAGKNYLQKSLIVFQFGLATFFIVLTLVQYRQVILLTSKDLGYDDKNLIVIDAERSKVSQGKLFVKELLSNPNIEQVAPKNAGTWITVASTSTGQQLSPYMNVVDEHYFKSLGLKIIEGRPFSDQYSADSTLSIIVNEAFVKEAGWSDAIGQTVKVMNRDPYQVIGVVKDYHFASLYNKVKPQLFTCNANYGIYGSFMIKLTGKNIPKTLDFIKGKFNTVYPTKPYSYSFLTDVNQKQYEKEFHMRKIALLAAILIIFISCMGLFGLSILVAEKQRKEIGVRKVLGASLPSIMGGLSLNFIKLIALGYMIFAPISYFTANYLLERFPYKVPIGLDLFFISFIGLMLISIVTISYQSLKAGMANPVESLRSE